MKDKPKRIMSRMCPRHMHYVELCPHCNKQVPCDEHIDRARNFKVVTPVYRVAVKYKGKQYNKTTEEVVV